MLVTSTDNIHIGSISGPIAARQLGHLQLRIRIAICRYPDDAVHPINHHMSLTTPTVEHNQVCALDRTKRWPVPARDDTVNEIWVLAEFGNSDRLSLGMRVIQES